MEKRRNEKEKTEEEEGRGAEWRFYLGKRKGEKTPFPAVQSDHLLLHLRAKGEQYGTSLVSASSSLSRWRGGKAYGLSAILRLNTEIPESDNDNLLNALPDRPTDRPEAIYELIRRRKG